MKATIIIEVSGSAKAIPGIYLEHLFFRKPLRFSNGSWKKTFKDFPISSDGELDFAILAAGIPSTKCEVKISVLLGNQKIDKEFSKLFGRRGWAIFKNTIHLKN